MSDLLTAHRAAVNDFIRRSQKVRDAIYSLHMGRLLSGKYSQHACWRLAFVHFAKWNLMFVWVGNLLVRDYENASKHLISIAQDNAYIWESTRGPTLELAKVADARTRSEGVPVGE